MAKKVKKMAFGGMGSFPMGRGMQRPQGQQGPGPRIGMPMVPPGVGGMGAMGRMGGAPSPMAQRLAAGQQQRMAMMQRDGLAGGPTFNSPRPAPVGLSSMNAPRPAMGGVLSTNWPGTIVPAKPMKEGGVVKKSKKSKTTKFRGDGLAQRGKTKGRMV